MTGEKRTETRMRCYNTLCIPYISLHPSLHACIVYDCREGRGVIYREYTECYSISFLFLFFFHQSSLYPIKIFAKCFYLLVHILFATKTLETFCPPSYTHGTPPPSIVPSVYIRTHVRTYMYSCCTYMYNFLCMHFRPYDNRCWTF